MRNPITWQNVNVPSFGESNRLNEAADNRMNAGLNVFTDVLKQRAATDNANWENQKTNNTQAFLNEVGKYRTPEEFQAAQQSGVFDNMRTGFSAQVDQNAIRNAEQNNLAKLQQQTKTGIEYADVMRKDAAAPLYSAIQGKVQQGNYTDAMADISKLDPRLQGAAIADLERVRQQDILNQRGTIEFGNNIQKQANENELFPGKKLLQEAQIADVNAQASLRAAQAEDLKNDNKPLGSKQQKFEKENLTSIYNAAKANNIYAGGTLGTPDGDKAFLESNGKLKLDDKDRTSVGAAMSRVQEKLKGVPIPLSLAQEAVYFTKNGIWNNRGDNVEEYILGKMLPNIDKYAEGHKTYQELTSNYQKSLANIGSTPSGNALNTAGSGTAATEAKAPTAPAASLPKPTASTGSWSVSKAPPSPYAGAGPDATPVASLPFGNSVVAGASSVGKLLDVVRGGENFKALGKPFDSYEERIRNRLALANQEAATKASKGKAHVDNLDDEIDNRVNPNIDNPVWMAAQRKAALAKNAKLPESVKKRLGIE